MLTSKIRERPLATGKNYSIFFAWTDRQTNNHITCVCVKVLIQLKDCCCFFFLFYISVLSCCKMKIFRF